VSPLAEAIERAREADILGVAERLGARLKKTGGEWVGPCPLCGGRDRFAVNVRKRRWHCRGCAKGGGVITLAQHVLGVDFRAAVAFLACGNALPTTAAATPTSGQRDAFVEAQVDAIVRELGPVRRSPGEAYLSETRKIDTAAIADILDRIDAVGWHPSVLFREEGHPFDGKRLGCIVGVMTDALTGKRTGAISRTYIHEGCKLGKPKTLGRPTGIVRLSADEDVLLGLHLAEGMETALAALAMGFRPIWSTGSASLMADFPVLAGVEALSLFADNDASRAGLLAANNVAARWRGWPRGPRIPA
jgi:hypothetical protein